MTPHQALEHLVNRAIEGKLVAGEEETLRILVHDFRPTPLRANMVNLLDTWKAKGGPPLGVQMNRWWDKRLAEFDSALYGRKLESCDHTAEFQSNDGPRSLTCALEKHDSSTQHQFFA